MRQSCGVPCGVRHAACVPLQVASVASTLMHCERCTLHRACGTLSPSRSDGAFCALVQGSTIYLPSQGGGVLFMLIGSATFESVAISDTSALWVRVAGGGRSVGGGVGRRCAGWWRGEDGGRIRRVQGRQHRTLFGGARSSSLAVVRVAPSGMGCVVPPLHRVSCMLQLVLRTGNVSLMLYGLRTGCT